MIKQLEAIVLLSGGLDSTTTLAIAKRDYGYDINAMTFRYGQRHHAEIESARRVAATFGVKSHIIVDIDLKQIGGSALTSDVPVPKNRDIEQSKTIPVTYVPARNTIFLSFALAWAEVLKIENIFIGVNSLDYSGYPDCRPEYITAYQKMANLATREGVEGRQRLIIHTPLLNLTKSQIIRRGLDLGVDFSMTCTCYDPSPRGEACGCCDACILRLKGFADNYITDPIKYI